MAAASLRTANQLRAPTKRLNGLPSLPLDRRGPDKWALPRHGGELNPQRGRFSKTLDSGTRRRCSGSNNRRQ
jgi:hypothetical protein